MEFHVILNTDNAMNLENNYGNKMAMSLFAIYHIRLHGLLLINLPVNLQKRLLGFLGKSINTIKLRIENRSI